MADLNDRSLDVSLTNEDKSKKVTVSTYGSEERLAVEAIVVTDTAKLILELFYHATQAIPSGLMRFKGNRYTVPSGYTLELLGATIFADDNKSQFIIGKIINLGNYNATTSTYTANLSYSTPLFGSGFFLEVTTVMGNVNDQVYTVTYTNQDGVSGRTATAVDGLKLKKNTAVGVILPMVLQAGDYGVRSIQAVSVDTTNTGAVALQGEINYINYANAVTNQSQQLQSSNSGWFVLAGETLVLDVGISISGGAATANRKINVAFSLAT